MKILLLLFIPAISFAQVLERNEVDEFTGRAVRETSYEVLVRNMKMNAFVSGFRVDSVYSLRLKLMIGAARVHAIDEGATFFSETDERGRYRVKE